MDYGSPMGKEDNSLYDQHEWSLKKKKVWFFVAKHIACDCLLSKHWQGNGST